MIRNEHSENFVIVAVCALALIWSAGCSEPPSKNAELQEYMDRAVDTWHFNGNVLVAKGDSILFRESFGMADFEGRRPLTPDSKFLIGSATKAVTAIAVMQLIDEGRLSLDHHLSRYLTDYENDVAKAVTVHHLLSHQSGIPDLIRHAGFRERVTEEIPVDDLIAFIESQAPEFEPGTRYAYSSSNYILLGKIIEVVTGETWEEYIRTNVTDPAGMFNTGVYVDYGTRDDFAVGYSMPTAPRHDTIKAPVIHPSCGHAAGALASTLDDLYSLHRALYAESVLPSASIELMLTPQTPFYAYGWLVDDPGGHQLTAHGGGAPGFASMFQRWIDDSVCVVVLSNNALVPVHTISLGLAAITLGEEYELPTIKTPVPIDREQLRRYAGCYYIDSSDYRQIELQGEQLVARRMNGVPMRIHPEAVDRFFFAHDHMSTLDFLRDENGDLYAHVFRQAFARDTAWLADR